MFSRIRKRLTYANVAMTLALVFAMSGGAYAANKYLITSTKQISPKVLKTLKGAKGANGANGANGTNGAAGPQGPQGPAGAAGAKGEAGGTGTEGKAGASVTSKEVKAGETACNKEGGSEFTAGSSKTTACNGSPWTAGGTLPSKKTLKGEWNAGGNASAGGSNFENSVSYALPLLVGPTVHLIRAGEGENEPEGKWASAIKAGKCKGSVEEPEASPGNLCVFAKQEENSVKTGGFGFQFPLICSWEAGAPEERECSYSGEGPGSRFGFGIVTQASVAGPVVVSGTWAVTAQ